MGNLATSDLPTIATLVLEMTILPQAIAMWFYTDAQTSWAVAACLVVVWEVSISFCFGVHSPFALLAGMDLVDAVFILGVLVIMSFIYAMIGSFFFWLLGGEEVLPFGSIFPLGMKHIFVRNAKTGQVNGVVIETCGDAKVIRGSGLNRWGMFNLPIPYMHTAVTTVLFAICVITPHVIYAFFMDDTGSNDTIALACAVLIPLIGYVITFAYWYIYPDVFVWGPSVKNFKALGKRYPFADDKVMLKRHTKEANARIFKTIIMMAVMHITGIIILGCVRLFRHDVDWNWTFAAVLAACQVVVILVAYFGLYLFRSKESKNVTTSYGEAEVVDMDGDEDDEQIDMELANKGDNNKPTEEEKLETNRFYQQSFANQQLSQRLNASGVV